MFRAALDSETSLFSYLLVLWFALTSVLVLGFVSVEASSASGNQFTLVNDTATDAASDTATDTAPVPAGPTTAGLVQTGVTAAPDTVEQPTTGPASLVYGGVIWSVVESRMVPAERTVQGNPIVIVEATVTNTTDDVTLRIRDSDIALAWPEGHREPLSRFDRLPTGVTSLSLQPGDRRDVTLVFKPNRRQDPELAGLTLTITEPGRIPGQLPLVGPAEPSPFPITSVVRQPPTTITDPVAEGQRLVITPHRTEVDINAGPFRANLETCLLSVSVEVDGTADWFSQPGFDYTRPDFWLLTIDGRPVVPSRVSRTAGGAEGRDLIDLLFVIDDTDRAALNADLTVGVGTGQSADYQLALTADGNLPFTQ